MNKSHNFVFIIKKLFLIILFQKSKIIKIFQQVISLKIPYFSFIYLVSNIFFIFLLNFIKIDFYFIGIT